MPVHSSGDAAQPPGDAAQPPATPLSLPATPSGPTAPRFSPTAACSAPRGRPACTRSRSPRRRCPPRIGLRPLKAWRYVGVYGPELMICVAAVRIGPARQAFWAVWDRARGRLHERTVTGRGSVELCTGRVGVRERAVQIELALDEAGGDRDVVPERRRVRVDAQAGRDRRPRPGGDRWGGARARGPRGDRRHRRLLRAAHVLAVVGGRRAGARRARRWRGTSWPGSTTRRTRASGPCGSRASPTSLRRACSPRTSARGRRAPLPRRGRTRARREPAAGPQPLPPAVRDVLR